MSVLKQAERCLANQKTWEALNAFIPFDYDRLSVRKAAQDAEERTASGRSKSEVDGQLIAIKDNICTTDWPTTCGSNILKGYESPYDATVIKKLHNAGAIITGKTNLDEFGMGSHSTHSAFGAVISPKSDEAERYSAGGSSGGSAVAVATGQCWAALGTDTGGSVRLPAAYTGIVGFKPSYGIVSRYGVISYANSLDTVGILAPNSEIVRKTFDTIKGYDSKDPTSLSLAARARILEKSHLSTNKRTFKIGVPIEYNIKELDPVVRSAWLKVLRLLKDDGHSVHQVSLPATALALSAYYVIAPAEASSNLAKYDGVRYGNQYGENKSSENVLFATTRGKGLGEEVRRRILLGSYSLSASAIDNYFIQAQRVRRLVQKDFNNVFTKVNPLARQKSIFMSSFLSTGDVDILISPTAPSSPPKLFALEERSPVEMYKDDVMTVPASLAGLPAMSVPVQVKDEVVGIQILAQYGDDDSVFEAARIIEALNGNTS